MDDERVRTKTMTMPSGGMIHGDGDDGDDAPMTNKNCGLMKMKMKIREEKRREERDDKRDNKGSGHERGDEE